MQNYEAWKRAYEEASQLAIRANEVENLMLTNGQLQQLTIGLVAGLREQGWRRGEAEVDRK